MLYYDRQLPPPLLRLLEDDTALGWLAAFVHSELGVTVAAHVQFRRNERDRKHGAIQVYFGRTSPLEIIGRTKDQVSFWADDAYRGPSPVVELFHEAVEMKALQYRRTRIERHLKATAERVKPAFVGGEGLAQAGLVRRYGPGSQPGDPFLVVDTEVRVGFASEDERREHEARWRRMVPLRPGEALPKKLDALAVRADGVLGLIEMKAEDGDLRRAAMQVAVHVAVFRTLIAARGAEYVDDAVVGLLRQKERVGLLGLAGRLALHDDVPLMPIIAAPDARDDWHAHWIEELDQTRRACGDLLAGLRLWRLGPDGEVLEERRA